MQIRVYIHHFVTLCVICIMTLFSATTYGAVSKSSSLVSVSDTLTTVYDSIMSIPDTLDLSGEAFIIYPDSTLSDSTQKAKPLFQDLVSYNAEDSIKFSLDEKKIYLYGKAFVKYMKTELTAQYIVMDMGQSMAFASGLPDTAGNIIGKPKLKDSGQEFDCTELKYNFKTGKAFVKEIITQEGDGYIQGKLTKRMSDSVYCVKTGWYTTCDEHDHPHFYIKMNKAKMIKNKKVVSGFAHLVIEDVPLPLFIPFGFFPLPQKYSSGFILPTYGEERLRGFNLRNGGYYWAISEYIDLAATGDIFTNGSWGINLRSNYKKKYKYNGSFNASMSKNYYSEKGLPDYSVSNDWSLQWTHAQDAKANPYSTFSASVDISSASNNYYNSANIDDIANQRKQSSISWSKKWPERPFSMTAAFSHNQNSRDSTISLTLPNINFRMTQIYPLRKKDKVGKLKWYDNIGISYSAELRNGIQTKESELLNSSFVKDWQNGFKHNIPISTTFNLLKDVSLSPSFNYEGVAYLNSIRKRWQTDTTLAAGGQVMIDTLYGFNYAHNYNASVSLAYNPTVYGMYTFLKPESKVFAIRHVIRPSISASYTPKIGVPRNKYWNTYAADMSNQDIEYSIYENGIYGTPSGATESGRVDMSVDNNVEMKIRNPQDTTGKEEFKKIKLLESFKISTSYDMFADSLNWSIIKLTARTKIFKDKINLNLSGDLDPYALSPDGKYRINKYNGGVGRLTRVSASAGMQFSSDKANKNKNKKNELVGGYYDNYMDFDVPWRINIDYTFSYSKPRFVSSISQMIRITGDISLTPKWKVGFNTGYDFEQKEVTATSFNISRDLHCWEMTFSCIPFGTHQSYNFQINVRSSLLQDLKLTKKDSWYDRR